MSSSLSLYSSRRERRARKLIVPLFPFAVFAFGFDEEIGGPQGAASIAPLLVERYGKHGIALLIDEGGNAVSQEYGKTFVLPGIGEKGGVSPTISVETAGGHSYVSSVKRSLRLDLELIRLSSFVFAFLLLSSTPTPFTSIGILARIVGHIEFVLAFPSRLFTVPKLTRRLLFVFQGRQPLPSHPLPFFAHLRIPPVCSRARETLPRPRVDLERAQGEAHSKELGFARFFLRCCFGAVRWRVLG